LEIRQASGKKALYRERLTPACSLKQTYECRSHRDGTGANRSQSGAAGAAGVGLPFVHGIPGISIRAIDDLQAAAQGRLQAALIRFGIDGDAIAKSGLAAQTIVDRAASVSAELVVVGTHGRTGLARLTLGSTAEAVMRSAPCSVLAVRLAVPVGVGPSS
jgi:nucleotide-binding universal stress UspA family protein